MLIDIALGAIVLAVVARSTILGMVYQAPDREDRRTSYDWREG
jgi:hypothetical protein